MTFSKDIQSLLVKIITFHKNLWVLHVVPPRWSKRVFHLKSWTIFFSLSWPKQYMVILDDQNVRFLWCIWCIVYKKIVLISLNESSYNFEKPNTKQPKLQLYFSLTPDRKLEWWQVALGSTSQSTNPGRSQLLFRDDWSTSSPPQARASTGCRFATEPFGEGRSIDEKVTSAKGMVRLRMSKIPLPKTKTNNNQW